VTRTVWQRLPNKLSVLGFSAAIHHEPRASWSPCDSRGDRLGDDEQMPAVWFSTAR
jgi:hypothetical protein